MSIRESSGLPQGRLGRGSSGDDGTTPAAPLDAAEERDLAARVKVGNEALEIVLSTLVPPILTSLPREGLAAFDPSRLGPSIRAGLRDAFFEYCPNGQPDDGLLTRAIVRIRQRVSAFLDGSRPNGDDEPFNGDGWAEENISAARLSDCLKNEEITRAWPAIRGRANAVRRLVEANLRLASTLAKCYVGRGLDFDDLRQIAVIALEKAAGSFDLEQGVPFRGYGSRVIRNDLAGAVRTARGGTAHSARERARFKHEEIRLAHEIGRRPTQTEVFLSLGCGKTKQKNLEQGLASASPQSLELYEKATGELPEDPRSVDPADEVERREDLQVMHATIEGLEVPERQVFVLRHLNSETLTQEETAKRLKLPLSRVRNLEASAWEKLRAPFRDSAAAAGKARG